MRKTIVKTLAVFIAVVPLFLFGQQNVVDQLFEKYSDQEDFTSIELTKGLFELFSEIEADDPDFDDFQKAVKGLESIKILAYSVEEGSYKMKEKFRDDIMASIPFKEYKELMVIKDPDANVNFYAKHEGQMISEMIMIVDGDDEAVLLSMSGNIDLSSVAKLGSGMKMGGMHHLGKMKDWDH
jgi:hypothetical protein